MPKDDIKNRVSIGTFGVGNQLEKDAERQEDIVKQTAFEVATHFGKRIDNRVIDNVTVMNLSNVFSIPKDKDGKKVKVDTSELDHFKELMQENSQSALSMLGVEQTRIANYENYQAICDNITECGLARDTYLANILSPDDYSKTIFDIDYKDTDQATVNSVKNKIKQIIKKYKLEEFTDDIIKDAITLGDCFVSVLPYDREIGKFLAATSGIESLNESVGTHEYEVLDEQFHLTERLHYETLTEDVINKEINMTSEEREVLTEAFGDSFSTFITDAVNKHIKVNSVTELLKKTAQLDNDIIFSKQMIETPNDAKSSKKKKKDKIEPVKINGAVIEKLDPKRIVKIEVNNVCYGYYYLQEGFDNIGDMPSSSTATKMYDSTPNPMNPSIYPNTGNKRPGDDAVNPIAKNMNISDEKLKIISGVLLKALSKKLNKSFIEDNKQFKDLLFSLLKQKYILEKGVTITYLLPEEVVHFHCPSIFEKCIFFAKIYLAILTNTVVIKMGRGHDKRIFYVMAGADSNHEQAILKLVQDVKTKEFKMSNLGSIASILSLNPGQFDDIYMATNPDGTHPVDIETIQGMDQEINNEFMEWLRKGIVNGTGAPIGILDALDNIEFARQISSQNAYFSRRIVQYQKKLTDPSNQLIRLIYKYETQYNNNDKSNNQDVDINNIEVSYPSPGSLNLSNMVDKFTQCDSAAETIAKIYIPDTMDQVNVDKQQALKMKILKDMLPEVDWEKYDGLYNEFKNEYTSEKLKKTPEQTEEDQFGDQYGQY